MVDEIDAELDRIANLIENCRKANVHVPKNATREQLFRGTELISALNALKKDGLNVGFEKQVDEARQWIIKRVLKLVE